MGEEKISFKQISNYQKFSFLSLREEEKYRPKADLRMKAKERGKISLSSVSARGRKEKHLNTEISHFSWYKTVLKIKISTRRYQLKNGSIYYE